MQPNTNDFFHFLIKGVVLRWGVALVVTFLGPSPTVANQLGPAADSTTYFTSEHTSNFGLSPTPGRKLGNFRRSENDYGTHYFQSTSAIPFGKREAWYKNTMVSLNTFSYGITKAWSVTGAVDLVSLISSKENGPVVSLRTQVSGSPSENFHLGVTAIYLRTRVPTAQTEVGQPRKAPGFVAGMGLITIGNADNQITLSGGAIHDGDQFARGPVFAIAGSVRLFPNVQLMTENYVITDPAKSFYVNSLGIRIIGEYLAIDIGIAFDAEFTTKVTPIGLPFIAATLNL